MNTTNKFFRTAITLVGICSLLFSSLQIQPTPVSAQGNDGIHRDYNAETGKVSHITGTGNEPITVMSAMSADMTSTERSDVLVERFAPEFGLTDPSEELIVADESQPEEDRVVTKYQQVYQGVPVLGGELIVNASDKGELYSMNGEVSQGLDLDTAPAITVETAIDLAKQGMAKWYGGSKADYQRTDSALYIFDESILRPSIRPAELVWKIEMTPVEQGQPIRELVLVNAETGNIPLHFNQVDTGWGDTEAELSTQNNDPAPTETATPLPTETPVPMETPIPTETSFPTESSQPDEGLFSIQSAGDVTSQSGATWYVATTGNDSNVCSSSSTPCLTINGAITQAAIGSIIYVASGTYTGTDGNVVTISKELTLSGGWDSSFSSQTGVSIIDGGGIRNGILSNSVTASMERFIIQNSNSNDSGGIYVYGGTFTLKNSTVKGNVATNRGGGIFLINNAIFYLINSTVSGNSANNSGGGIYVSSGSFNPKNSTVVYNTANTGGGLAVESGTTTVWNTILANNSAISTSNDCQGSISMSGSVLEDTTGCIISSGIGNQLNLDPNINNTLTGISPLHALLPGSPAIDHGNPSLCEPKDQRGMLRPRGNGCDIGSYEYAPNGGIGIVSGSGQTASVEYDFANPLTVYVIDSSGNPVPNLTITFTAPASGASGTFFGTGNIVTAKTNTSGQATSPVFKANNTAGSYTIVASAPGYTETGVFSLTNDGGLYVAPTGSDTNTCKTTTDPCATIQAAVYKAAYGAKVNVAVGTYTSTSNIVVALAQRIILSGGWDTTFEHQVGVSTVDGENMRPGIKVVWSDVYCVIDHFQIQNGKSDQGGGIYNNGTLTITDSIIQNNSVINGFYGVSSIGADGGGVYNSSSGSLTINNSEIKDNTAVFIGSIGAGGDGGGIYSLGNDLTINNSTIEGNSATFSGLNPEMGGDGGGMVVHGNVVIRDSTIKNNYSSRGSGIASSATSLSISNSLITGNNSYNDGAGIYLYTGNLDMTNVTISNNTAKSSGGGIYIKEGSATINNSTITQNIAEDPNALAIGGGLSNYFNKPVILRNTLIVGNGADTVPDCRGEITSAGHNLIGYGDGCFITPMAGDQIGQVGSPINAKIGNLLDNGGATFTHALLTGSPAIDAGDPTSCASTDQRGVSRPQGVACDIGAYEGSSSQAVNAVVRTYTANHTNAIPGNLLCDQPTPNCDSQNADANNAHRFALGTYNLYHNQFGRNGIDNNNMPILSTVQYQTNYQNASWIGSLMLYGDGYGFANADDIVAHELTHGVTQYESNLFYFYQSGAINESLSDIFGEYYDQNNYIGNDTANVKWLLGEDVTGWTNPAPLPPLGQRSMSDPTVFGDPDMMTSTYYYKGTADRGGVHWNSGVNNKAAFLMVDGGTLNKKTVTGIGWDKTAAIYYEAQTHLLTSGSDYSDLYYILQQACVNLIGQKGITPADCAQVKNAIDAVQMNSEPVTGFNPEAPACPAGMTTVPAVTFFQENFENNTTNWILSGAWKLDTQFATSGTYEMWGDDKAAYGDSHLTMANGISLPAGSTPFLYFKHAYVFDYDSSGYYDGAVLEYSKDNGSTWIDAQTLYSAGKNYAGTIAIPPAGYESYGSVLQGRYGFVGDSHGYVSSRYDLTSLAGQTVKFRWRFSTDFTDYLLGWFVDDVSIYQCVGTPAIPTLQSPLTDTLTTDYTPYLNWSDVTPSLHHYQVQIATDITFTSPVVNQNNLPTSEFTVLNDLPSNTTYYWRVQALNAIGGSLGWSPTWTFRTALLPPGLTSPTQDEHVLNLRPTFTWNAVPNATGYTIEISSSNAFTSPITGNPTLATFTPTTDLPIGVLYWRVQTRGANGPSSWSVIRSYNGPNPPPAPILGGPANNRPILNLAGSAPTFTWNNVAVPAGTTFKEFQFQLGISSDLTTPLVNSTQTSTSYHPSLSMTSNTNYFWRVRAINTLGELGAWSQVWSLSLPPERPSPLLPAEGSKSLSLRPTFEWNPVVSTGYYTVQISQDREFTQIISGGTSTSSSFTPKKDLPTGSRLYWRVRAEGAGGIGVWSTIRTFDTPTPPGIPTPIQPSSGASMVELRPTFSWNLGTLPRGTSFDHIQLQVSSNPVFSTLVVDHNIMGAATARYTTTVDLLPNAQYYWRIRAYNKDSEMSSWSETRSFITMVPLPASSRPRSFSINPNLPAPLDSYSQGSPYPILNWTEVGDATSYIVQASTGADFVSSDLIISATTVPSDYVFRNSMFAGSTLYWRVRTISGNTMSNWSEVYTLQIP
jgi:Zn-dependent metalloprotease